MSESAITVIVPFRHQGALLHQACRSLQHQSQTNWHGLLVNDHSDLSSVAIAEGFCRHDPRFQLLHVAETRHFPGPWLARNLGLQAASTPLVAFLDADDLWHPLKLECQLRLHRHQPRVLSVCSYHRFQAADLKLLETRCPPDHLDFAQLLRGNAIPLSTVIADRQALLAVGGFLPERHEDYGLWLRLFAGANPPSYRRLNEPLMAYRIHPQSLSAARHRSLLAVNHLFRQHLRRRQQRWPALARWGLERLHAGLAGRAQASCRQLLPQPFRALATI